MSKEVVRKSMYHISEEYLNIIQQVEEADGELSSELGNKLAINEKEVAAKCVAYYAVMNRYESGIASTDAEIAVLNKEIKRLNDLKKEKIRHWERLEQTLLDAVVLFGVKDKKTDVKRLEFETLKLSTRKAQGGVQVHKQGDIETKYCDFSLSLSNLTQDDSKEVSELIVKYFEEKDKSFNLKDTNKVNFTRIKEAIKEIKKKNEAKKTLGKTDDLEPEEVPGAFINPDKTSLVIK